ncbi:EamA family transporter RarD [Corticibacter populi]|uniref:EamA family transporter RarD n=1 Tax=Corticibacter populi TaxID=1550736 RepID=A0A3M6QZ38_9BURK|nr:EamA family transporter RarD [Corticibacter populi]RMX08294.1 EamA family transporter RarD [Corticibacter populi]RZS35576.1 chloramphenicol-sensitive protein RarD [Corticibacter populi]
MPSAIAADDEVRLGVLYAVLAFSAWGFMTIYWKWVAWMPSGQLIAYRVLWTFVLMLPLLSALRGWRQLGHALRQPRVMLVLSLTAALISVNWLTFVWAVTHAHVVQASLGYFINPLLNVLLGVIVLHERLRPAQWLAVALAVLGVCWQVWALGVVPWIALLLGGTFAVYGLLRKFTPVSGMVGLGIETMLIFPVALLYLLWVSGRPEAVPLGSHGLGGAVLVMLSGVITAAPLLWFANAAQRLRLSTLGFFQYLAPSLQLMLGVFVYHEDFTRQHLISFGLIWIALLVYSIDTVYTVRQNHRLRTCP